MPLNELEALSWPSLHELHGLAAQLKKAIAGDAVETDRRGLGRCQPLRLCRNHHHKTERGGRPAPPGHSALRMQSGTGVCGKADSGHDQPLHHARADVLLQLAVLAGTLRGQQDLQDHA